MEIIEKLKLFTEPKTYLTIEKLSIEKQFELLTLIQNICEKTDRNFLISNIINLNDDIEVEIKYKTTIFK